jgi:hypothetical protein
MISDQDLPPVKGRVDSAEPASRIQRIDPTRGTNYYLVIDTQSNQPQFVPRSAVRMASAEQRFNELAEQWYIDTLASSSYYDKILHPAYQKILRLDAAAIPLILRELEAMPNDWFWALRIITETDPVQPEQAGDMQAMADAWLAWGRDEGYI